MKTGWRSKIEYFHDLICYCGSDTEEMFKIVFDAINEINKNITMEQIKACFTTDKWIFAINCAKLSLNIVV